MRQFAPFGSQNIILRKLKKVFVISFDYQLVAGEICQFRTVGTNAKCQFKTLFCPIRTVSIACGASNFTTQKMTAMTEVPQKQLQVQPSKLDEVTRFVENCMQLLDTVRQMIDDEIDCRGYPQEGQRSSRRN